MAKKGKLTTVTEYVGARLVLSGLSCLPRFVAVAIGRGLAGAGYRIGGRLRRTGERNLSMAFPQLEENERRRILRGCFSNLGRLLGEFSQLPKVSPSDLADRIEVRGLEHLEQARLAGKGVILFTGHIGAWELSSFTLSALGYPLSFLVRRIDNRLIENMVEATRTRFGNRSIDKRAAIRPIIRTLHAGETVGILVDLNTQRHEGVFVDFFGIPACTTSGIASIALRTNAPVLPVFIPWDEASHKFILHIDPPLEVTQTGDLESDALRLTGQITKIVERYVRRYPEQWLWIHKRWNTRPLGEPDLYSNR